jgi:hypothetical protein
VASTRARLNWVPADQPTASSGCTKAASLGASIDPGFALNSRRPTALVNYRNDKDKAEEVYAGVGGGMAEEARAI